MLQTAGRVALARGDFGTASSQLSEAISLLEANGEAHRGDVATTWYNLATAQMQMSDPATAASSYLNAREIEAAIFGQNHPYLISTEYNLAAALHACSNFAAAKEAINRCLQIIRKGSPQARLWRQRALKMAILIDLNDRSQPI
jgi:tetratricopeptide (TPR) repeat protein